jgi:hypothetical protein
MRKVLSLLVVLVSFAVFAQAAFSESPTPVVYYDANGIRVYGDSLYQTHEGWLCFGRSSYYFDQYGNKVSANGRRAFYYDLYGNFIAGRSMAYIQDYYDTNGNVISRTSVYYYDIYGNLVATSAYDYRYGGYSNYDYYRYYSAY